MRGAEQSANLRAMQFVQAIGKKTWLYKMSNTYVQSWSTFILSPV